jgi:2-keto-4-pentenoate hydratase/2-oxohepta-3-ene-1,7-dioic acid hydratase in catechol pathway
MTMRLATYSAGGAPCVGVVLEDGSVLDGAAALRLSGGDPAPLADMIATIEAWDRVGPVLAKAAAAPPAGAVVAKERVRLLAPIPRPRKNVFCVGRNYLDHVAEGDRAAGRETSVPEHAQFFTKPANVVIGPGEWIPNHAGVTRALDYEVELVVVIGRGGADIPRERAFEHVFGYTIGNDITGRDLQRRHGQWFKGKGLDRSCPMGPWIVPRGDLPEPPDLRISLTVNGEQRQDSRTSRMIFDIPAILAVLSAGLTLEPGDVIMTGTPEGVGYAMTPPRLLQPGDRIAAAIEGIGVLENEVR